MIIDNLLYIGYSLMLHIVLIIFFVIAMEIPIQPVIVQPKSTIIQVTAIDEGIVLAEITLQQRLREKRLRADNDKQIKVENRLKEIRNELVRKEENMRQQKVEQERLIEANRQAEIKLEYAAEEVGKLVEERRRRSEAANRASAVVQEVEELRKSQIAKADRLLQDSIAKNRLERNSKHISSMVNRYTLIIEKHINRYWIPPINTKDGLQVTLRVRLSSGGDVKKVTVVESSGDTFFDRSAELAVYKAAPLPQPKDLKFAGVFDDFIFIFKP